MDNVYTINFLNQLNSKQGKIKKTNLVVLPTINMLGSQVYTQKSIRKQFFTDKIQNMHMLQNERI